MEFTPENFLQYLETRDNRCECGFDLARHKASGLSPDVIETLHREWKKQVALLEPEVFLLLQQATEEKGDGTLNSCI